MKPDQEQISTIEKLIENPATTEDALMHYHYAFGKIHEHCQMYDRSFEHFHRANTLKRKSVPYNSQKHSRFVSSLIENYSKSYFLDKSDYGSDSRLPIFIVGMPRSCTTLVEQIVSNHKKVRGAGELVTLKILKLK